MYIGVTNDVARRVYEHKSDIIEGFTKKYSVHRLVYYEETKEVKEAIKREKQIKNWRRSWKIELIESINPGWKDLYNEMV